LKQSGCRIVAATEKASQNIDHCDLRGPVAVIIGNEGEGIAGELLAVCDTHARIPMRGRVASLNAAVAAGIVCYEIARQREAT